MAIVNISIDIEPLVAALTELAAEIPFEFIDSAVSLADAPDEFVRLECGDPANTGELLMTLYPSDALLGLASAVGTRER